MGVCPSKHRVSTLRLGRPSDSSPPHIGLVSPEFLASTESATSCWGWDQPRLLLGNNSGYRVSYWVMQEDKKRTMAHNERIVTSMGLHLNLSSSVSIVSGGAGLKGGVTREKEEIIETERGRRVYFLLRDFRMEPKGSTQPTLVPFPAGCQEVRVCAFFEEEDDEDGDKDEGGWRPYKDKVYSIGRGNKTFTLNALDSNIKPYTKAKAGRKRSSR